MFRLCSIPSVVLTCSLASFCGRTPGDVACELGASAVVVNSGPGDWSGRQVQPRLVELWRAAGAHTKLGYPAALAASPTGRLAVADFDGDRVLVLADDGRLLGDWPLGRNLGKPIALTWSAGEQLHIFDLGASALITVDSLGRLLRKQTLSQAFLDEVMQAGGLDWAGVLPGGTVYFQPLAAIDPAAADRGQSLWVLWRQKAGTQRVDTVVQTPARLFGYTMLARTPVPTWPRLRAAAGGNGLLAMGGEDGSYRIRLYQDDGTRLRTICRDARPLPLTPEEQGEVEQEREAELLRAAPQPTTPAAFGHLFFSAEGQLWVQRDRPFILADPYTAVHGNPGGLFDVFDLEGRYLGELRAPAGVRLRAATGDRVWGIEPSETEGVDLIAYQLLLE